jgi:DNA helicase-2/ATP-dependent DNA helicase PcrA
VCGQILKRREAGVPLKRQAVLFRNASASDVLEVELARRKIPFVKYGGLKFLEAAHIKDLLAVLRWADNLRNTLAAFRVLQLLPGMGPVNARKCVELLRAGRTARSRRSRALPPPQPMASALRQAADAAAGADRAAAALARPGAPGARLVSAAPRAHL